MREMRQHCAEFRANFCMVFMDDFPSKKASGASVPDQSKKSIAAMEDPLCVGKLTHVGLSFACVCAAKPHRGAGSAQNQQSVV